MDQIYQHQLTENYTFIAFSYKQNKLKQYKKMQKRQAIQFYQILRDVNHNNNSTIYKKREEYELECRNSLKAKLTQAKQKNCRLEVYSICNQLLKFQKQNTRDIIEENEQFKQIIFQNGQILSGFDVKQKKYIYKRINSQRPINKYYRVIVVNDDNSQKNSSQKTHPSKSMKTHSENSYNNSNPNNECNFNIKKQVSEGQNTLNKCFSGLTIKSRNTQATDTNKSQIILKNYQKSEENKYTNFLEQCKQSTKVYHIEKDKKEYSKLNLNLNISSNLDLNQTQNKKLKTKTTLQMLYEQQSQSKNKHQNQQQKHNLNKKQIEHQKSILYSSFIVDLNQKQQDQNENMYSKRLNTRSYTNQNLTKQNYKMNQSRILQFCLDVNAKTKCSMKKLVLEQVPLGYEQQQKQNQQLLILNRSLKQTENHSSSQNYAHNNNQTNGNVHIVKNIKNQNQKPHQKVLLYKNKLVSLFELKNSQSKSDLQNFSHSQKSVQDGNQFFKFGIQTESKIFQQCYSVNSHENKEEQAKIKEDLNSNKNKVDHLKQLKSKKKSASSLKLSRTKLQALQEQDYFQNVPKFKQIKALKKSCYPKTFQKNSEQQKYHLNLPSLQKFKLVLPSAQQTPRFGKIVSFQQQMNKKKLCSSIIQTQPQLIKRHQM